MSKVHFVLDCSDPQKLAPFWANALGYEIKWTFNTYVGLGAPSGDGEPMLLLQRVSEQKSVKNRAHIDIYAQDINARAEELVELGATRIDPTFMQEGPAQWVRMLDPESNEFCVCKE